MGSLGTRAERACRASIPPALCLLWLPGPLSVCLHVVLPHLFLNGIYSFIFAFFVAVHGLFLVVVSGGYSLVVVCRLLTIVASLVVELRL